MSVLANDFSSFSITKQIIAGSCLSASIRTHHFKNLPNCPILFTKYLFSNFPFLWMLMLGIKRWEYTLLRYSKSRVKSWSFLRSYLDLLLLPVLPASLPLPTAGIFPLALPPPVSISNVSDFEEKNPESWIRGSCTDTLIPAGSSLPSYVEVFDVYNK